MQKVFFTRIWKILSFGVLFNIESILSNPCLVAACHPTDLDALCRTYVTTSKDPSDQAACISAWGKGSTPVDGKKCVFDNEHMQCLPDCTKEEGKGQGLEWAQ